MGAYISIVGHIFIRIKWYIILTFQYTRGSLESLRYIEQLVDDRNTSVVMRRSAHEVLSVLNNSSSDQIASWMKCASKSFTTTGILRTSASPIIINSNLLYD